MEEWVHDEVQRRIDYTVQHSDFCLNDKEYKEIEEYEYSLVRKLGDLIMNWTSKEKSKY